jgi:PAS domain S-box-containing protein
MHDGRLYEEIVQDIPLGFSIVDKDGTIVEFNPEAERITGLSRKEALGRSHMMLLHGTADLDACPLMRESVRYRRKRTMTEATIKTPDGAIVTIEVASFPLYGGQGEFLGGAEVFRDITGQKRRERERRNFLSMFVHDMKTPLISSSGFLRRMREGKAGPLTQEQEEYLDLVTQELGNMERLVGDYLEYARLEAEAMVPEFAPVDLGDILVRTVEALRVQAEERGVGVEVRDTGDLTLSADEGMVERVLQNLLSNAFSYADPGSTVRVRAEGRAGWVFVEVVNSSSGLSEEDLPYVFDAFHSRGRKGKGTGLGLSIAKHMVDLHGGRIWARVAPENDVAFAFALPRDHSPRD